MNGKLSPCKHKWSPWETVYRHLIEDEPFLFEKKTCTKCGKERYRSIIQSQTSV